MTIKSHRVCIST